MINSPKQIALQLLPDRPAIQVCSLSELLMRELGLVR